MPIKCRLGPKNSRCLSMPVIHALGVWRPRKKALVAKRPCAAMNGTPTCPRAGLTHRRLLEAAQTGNQGALQEMVRRYEPLVRRVVWRIRPPLGTEREDLAQEARIGLVAAIRAWRPERGPFPAFADRCVRNQALLAVQAAARHKHQLLS